MITILYFASLREQLDQSREQLSCPPGVTTIGELRQWLCQRGMPWSQALDSDALIMASLNQSVSEMSNVIDDGDEIAFFPPVTGG